MISRRGLISGVAGVSAACVAVKSLAEAKPSGALSARADDEAGWAAVAAEYDVAPEIINLENGNWGLMARPVLAAYQAHTERVNRENSFYARRGFGEDFRRIRTRVALALGVGEDEIAFTRGATEALQNLIGGYRGLKPGDKVMIADLDYDSIQSAMEAKAAREGAELVRLSIPEPADHDGLIDFYLAALEKHPQTKLLLLTHISHRTGLCIPVRAIAEAVRVRGVDVVVDAAHSWGQLDFKAPDLGADFVGFNLHKWIGAPIGVGVLYIKRDRLDRIEPNISASEWERGRIEGRVHTGTSNFAAMLAVDDALDFHERVGSAAKEARLEYLRNRWVSQVKSLDSIEILTAEDSRLHAGITSFRMRGMTSIEDNVAIVEELLDKHRIFTVHRTGVAAGACVRVTPSLYNSASDVDALAVALKAMS
ncbi:MAG: aminotransferase class V-fold PLP-dependent enzyme [Amphiplicatus sp.]